jgi:hypothetical protein
MALRITCSCGKNLQVHDDLAGKKVKCPACGTILVAGAAASATAVKAAAPRLAPGAAAMDRDKVSPKPMAKRPAPPPMDDDVDERPVRPRRNRDEDEDDYEDRPARSAKKGKKKAAAGGSLLWLWLSLGGVVLIGGGIAVYFLFFNGPPTTAAVAQNQGGNQQGGAGNQNPQQGEARNIVLADWVPGDAWMFASVSGGLWNAKALDAMKPMFGTKAEEEFQKTLGFPLSDVERVTVTSVTSLEEAKKMSLGPAVIPVVVVVHSKTPFNQQQVTAAVKNGDLGKNPNVVVEFINDRTMVTSLQPLVQMYKNKRSKIQASGALAQALNQANASKGVVASLIVTPELAQQAASAPGGMPPAFLKTKAMIASFELTERVQVRVSLTMEDAAAAVEAKKAVDGLVALGGLMLNQPTKDPVLALLSKAGQQAMQSLQVNLQDKEVVVTAQVDAKVLEDLSKQFAQSAGNAATAVVEINNLKQIGLAWHNYHATYTTFPPQTIGKGLSWRVAILPFIEQVELYRQFNMKEPWDGPTNRRLIPLMPKVYESVGNKAKPGFTYYQTFVGPNTINKTPTQGIRLQAITDGTSNTIVVAESGRAVEWTKPDDIAVSPNQPITMGGANPQGFLAVFADGLVQRVPRSVNQQVLRWLIDPADGNVIPNLNMPLGQK